MAAPLVSFGPFSFDPDRRVLTRDGTTIAMGQRSAALLTALIEAKGATISKADLMQRAWPDSFVEEGNLTVQIALLRKLIGQDADARDWIVTVPRLGYRLLTAPAAEVARVTVPTLAVMPFQNLGADSETDYFADGIVIDIIGALARFRSLSVLSRSSSFVFKDRQISAPEAASALGATYLLEGSVRRAGDRLRITAQLIDGATGASLWSDRLDGDLSDVFAFQDQITERVAGFVAPAVEVSELDRSRRERPQSLATYDIYLRALSCINTETEAGNAEAHALLTQALKAEPDNPLLLAHAAWVLEHRTTMGWPALGPDDFGLCVAYARRGIRVADGNANVLAHCAIALVQTGRDYDAGVAVIRAAVAANPYDMSIICRAGVIFLHCGSLDEARDFFHRAIRLRPSDPLIRFPLTGLAHAEIVEGNPELALEYATRSLAVNDRFDATYWMLIAANADLGRIDRAETWAKALLALSPDVTLERICRGQPACIPARIDAILDGMRRAGFPAGGWAGPR